jgi:serine O-acetyltransferase
MAVDAESERRSLIDEINSRHPGFRDAVLADARVTASFRGERAEFRPGLDSFLQVLRLIWVTDAFAAQILYRAKARMLAKGIPVLPRIAHRLALTLAQVSIGDRTVVEPGVYIVHGQIVIDGITNVGERTVISPFVTIGLRAGDFNGPTIERDVNIGTGAKIIGPVTVGTGAKIGANAVVVDDVEAGATVVGAPAKTPL